MWVGWIKKSHKTSTSEQMINSVVISRVQCNFPKALQRAGIMSAVSQQGEERGKVTRPVGVHWGQVSVPQVSVRSLGYFLIYPSTNNYGYLPIVIVPSCPECPPGTHLRWQWGGRESLSHWEIGSPTLTVRTTIWRGGDGRQLTIICMCYPNIQTILRVVFW